MKLLSFELKKMIFDKKFLYLTLLLIGIVGIIFIRNMIFESYIVKEENQKLDNYISTTQSNGRMISLALLNDPENEKYKTLDMINWDMIDILYDLRTISSADWQLKLQLENTFLAYVLDYKNAKGDHPLTISEIKKTIAFNEKLLEDNIKPEHPSYSLALPNFLKIITNLFINLGSFILVILFIGDIFSSEFENRSIHLLFTQPLKKQFIITSKFISSLVVYLFITFILFATSFIVGLLFGLDGTFEYPILIEKNNEFQFITISDYIFQGLIVTTCFTVFVISLILFCSLLFKNTIPTLFSLIITLLAGFGLTLLPVKLLFWLNPFQYVLADRTLLFQNETVWYQGIPISILLAVLLYLISDQKVRTIKMD